MSASAILFGLAAILAFLAAAAIVAIPNAVLWILFLLSLAFLVGAWRPRKD